MKSWMKILMLSAVPIISVTEILSLGEGTEVHKLESMALLAAILSILVCVIASIVLFGLSLVSFVKDADAIWRRYQRGKGDFSQYDRIIIQVVRVLKVSVDWIFKDGWR